MELVTPGEFNQQLAAIRQQPEFYSLTTPFVLHVNKSQRARSYGPINEHHIRAQVDEWFAYFAVAGLTQASIDGHPYYALTRPIIRLQQFSDLDPVIETQMFGEQAEHLLSIRDCIVPTVLTRDCAENLVAKLVPFVDGVMKEVDLDMATHFGWQAIRAQQGRLEVAALSSPEEFSSATWHSYGKMTRSDDKLLFVGPKGAALDYSPFQFSNAVARI